MAVVVYTPVESSQPGFFVIPGYSIYGADRNGTIKNLKTGHVKRPYRVRGYLATTVMSDSEKKMKWVFIHRLVAMAFHGPAPPDKPIVNHLDGSKDNNVPENLEWTTYSGNISHAYQNGQRTDNRPVLAKSLLDGSVVRFQTANDCARHFQVSGERIWRNIRDNTGNIYFGHYVFRFEDDDRPWPNLGRDDVGKVNNGEGKPVMAKELSTGKIYLARSASQMGKLLGIGESTITYVLRSPKQGPCKGYLFKLQSDQTHWRE